MKKYVILFSTIIIFFGGLSFYQFFSINDGKLHIVVCDVGQGDAVYIRTPKGHSILFDGGPDKSVLNCLRDAMPFWERSFDLLLLSHPHADHLNGLIDVFKRYTVKQFATEDLANTSEGYKTLQSAVKKEHLVWQTLLSGDKIKTQDGVMLSVLGPTRLFLDRTAVKGKYITSTEFASLQMLVAYKSFSYLLTGDSQYQEMGELVSGYHVTPLTVLQEPHHGSRTGITPEIIKALRPKIVTISVGAHNTYGHPAPNTLAILQNAGVEIHRTDKEGTLRLVTDGKSYNLR